MYFGPCASGLWHIEQSPALFWEWLLFRWHVMHWLDSVTLFLTKRCVSSGLVMLCIGPWQMKHGTVELGVWNVELNVEPFSKEYKLRPAPLSVDLLEMSDLFAGV